MDIENLRRILRINSEEGEASEGKPFGEGVGRCLEEVLKIGEEMGFTVKNVDGYGGHIDWEGAASEAERKIFGIIGHLDVVPAGNGWTHEPYGADIEDGYIYGRGTTDDKGPMMVCLEAMKALKDEGFVPRHTVRLIWGCDEETNWKGVKYYFEKEKRPDFGFTPDADFPIINGEKGILHFILAKKFIKPSSKGLELRTLKGGTAANAVADFARAVVKSSEGYDKIKKAVEDYKLETGYKVACKSVGKSLEITASGIAAHGAKPESGLNAISVIMQLLGRLNFFDDDRNDFIGFYNQHLGFFTKGEKMGCCMKDDLSGDLSMNVGMIDLDSEAAKLTMDVRYPVSKSSEAVYKGIAETVERYGIGIVRSEDKAPIFTDVQNPLVTCLLDIYKKHTGDNEAQPIVIGGGTYARATPGIVAFGAQLPGEEDLMHQKNERISLKNLDLLFDIYKEAILRLMMM